MSQHGTPINRATFNADSLVAAWNQANEVGSEVILTDDFGDEHETRTRSIAWVAGRQPLVSVEGRTGGYLLTRIRRRSQGDDR